MWLVVIVLLINIYSSKGVPEIKIFLRQHNGTVTCPSDDIISPKLTLNQKFRLSVHSDVNLYDGKCYTTNTNYCVNNFTKEKDFHVLYKDLVLRKIRNKTITCEFCTKSYCDCNKKTQDRFYSVAKCKFKIDLRELDFGFLAVNGIQVPTKKASETDIFDSSGVYSFYDGEPASVACHNLTNLVYSQLLYTNAYGIVSTNTQLQLKPLEMYIKLMANDNGSYIDCILKDYDKTWSFITRVYFKHYNTLSGLGFQVNGLIQSLGNPSHCEQNFCNKYQYYDGEILTIESFKNEPKYGDVMNCSTETKNIRSLPKELNSIHGRQTNFHIITTLHENVGNITLICDIEEHTYLQNKKTQISLLLMPNKDYSPVINGLSRANVFIMYKNVSIYSISNAIHYKYDKELTLECHSSTSRVKWLHNESEVEITEIIQDVRPKFKDSKNLFIINSHFKLKDGCNTSVIQCVSPKSMGKSNKTEETTMVFIRRQKKDVLSDNVLGNDAVISDATTNRGILIGAGLGTLVLIVIVMFFIINLTKKKLQASIQNPTYVNLSGPKEGNKSAPQNYEVYATPINHETDRNPAKTLEELYSKPTPKNQRKHENKAYTSTDVPFSQILFKNKHGDQAVQVLPTGDVTRTELKNKKFNAKTMQSESSEMSKQECPYAEVSKQESPYAEVSKQECPNAEVSKEERPYAEVSKQECPYAEVSKQECPYAEVSKQESPYAEVSKQECPYAEVSIQEIPYVEMSKQESPTHSENPYAEPYCRTPTKKYVNVFQSQGYVNDTFVEPAYCEVGKIDK